MEFPFVEPLEPLELEEPDVFGAVSHTALEGPEVPTELNALTL